MIKLCLPQISRHHTGSFPPGLDALPAVRDLLPVLALPHPLLHPLPGGRHLLLVLVRLHQLRLPGLRGVWGRGGSQPVKIDFLYFWWQLLHCRVFISFGEMHFRVLFWLVVSYQLCNSYKPRQGSTLFHYQVGKIGLILTLLYCLMMVPIMLLYRYMELHGGDLLTVPVPPRLEERMDNMSGRKYPPRYDESECHFRFLVAQHPAHNIKSYQ